MNVRKTDTFLADIERQYGWYVSNAGVAVADRYLNAVETVCGLLSHHPNIGPAGGFAHPKLRDWRFFPVLRPFGRHILFYQIVAGEVVLRRPLHGHRDLQGGLLDPASDH